MKQQSSLLTVERHMKISKKELEFNPPKIIPNKHSQTPLISQLSNSSADFKIKGTIRKSNPYSSYISRIKLPVLKSDTRKTKHITRSESSSPNTRSCNSFHRSRIGSKDLRIPNNFPDLSIDLQKKPADIVKKISEDSGMKSIQLLNFDRKKPEIIKPLETKAIKQIYPLISDKSTREFIPLSSDRTYEVRSKAETPSLASTKQSIRRPVFSIRKSKANLDISDHEIENNDSVIEGSKIITSTTNISFVSKVPLKQHKFDPSFANLFSLEPTASSPEFNTPNKLNDIESISKFIKLEPHRFAIEFNSLRKIRSQNTKRSRVKRLMM
ncbi:unnamed protein product [Blepharisma stoltei]|uniref:Uncharacterized protein n=1 Tax=Blepharisma stoltei TaxID=1481888 RepID=A0AAU9KQ36_9CILI|nr:unnamed protein product [Blepharisma stoltei]